MTSVDPSTGRPLPNDAIQRVLFVASAVHVYSIPPLTSNKGYTASQWTADNNKRQIFTARLRVLETAIPSTDVSGETVKTDILLEDPSSGQLFAAAPYTNAYAVEQVVDSSRFFAVRVVGDGGMKAVLGIGFEERSEAFDFGVALQEVRKVQGTDRPSVPAGAMNPLRKGRADENIPEKVDFSLKEGETIKVDIGGRGRRQKSDNDGIASWRDNQSAAFSIAPPPAYGDKQDPIPFLPPPPNVQDMKAGKIRERQKLEPEQASATDLGFDDGEFGEFQ